jgi:leucine-rich repeat protein SHOC2
MTEDFLDFSKEKESTVLIALKKYKNPKKIRMSWTTFKYFPLDVFQFTDLIELDFSSNKLEIIPHEIGRLINLENLDLSNNQYIDTIPKEICELTNLRKLVLYIMNSLNSQFHLEYFEYYGNLKNLEVLWINMNQIKYIPDELGELKKLNSLKLDSNNFETIPTIIGKLDLVKIISFGQCQIKDLKGIRELKNISELELNLNCIVNIPEEISELKNNLIRLDLSNNKIEVLPKEIGELTNLKCLNLENNKIKYIPKEIEELKNLLFLNLKINCLENIPISLELLHKNIIIDLGQNPFPNKHFDNVSQVKLMIENYRITKKKDVSTYQSINSLFSYFKSDNKLQNCANVTFGSKTSYL